MCDRANQRAVLSLIEKRAGLLSSDRCHAVANVAFMDLDAIGYLTACLLDDEREAFMTPYRGVVAQEDAARYEHLFDRIEHVVTSRLEAS